MPLKVSEKLCNACGICVEVCPMDAIRLTQIEIEADSTPSAGRRTKIPYMKYDECWYCGSCEKDCPQQALTVVLPFLVR